MKHQAVIMVCQSEDQSDHLGTRVKKRSENDSVVKASMLQEAENQNNDAGTEKMTD